MAEENLQPNGDPPKEEGANVTAIATQDLAQLRQSAAERDQFLDLAKRTQAEFENYQKRCQKERELERRYAIGPWALDLLPVLDNLDRALTAARKVDDPIALVQGVAMVQNQLLELLKRHGVTSMDAQGKPFDPNLHQAVLQQLAGDQEPNTVLQVLEQGFLNQDRVLRPAKVIVSSQPA